jgi:hypothetical protein
LVEDCDQPERHGWLGSTARLVDDDSSLLPDREEITPAGHRRLGTIPTRLESECFYSCALFGVLEPARPVDLGQSWRLGPSVLLLVRAPTTAVAKPCSLPARCHPPAFSTWLRTSRRPKGRSGIPPQPYWCWPGRAMVFESRLCALKPTQTPSMARSNYLTHAPRRL